MHLSVDESLGLGQNRVDLTSGNPEEPFEFIVNATGTTNGFRDAAINLVHLVSNVGDPRKRGHDLRVHCTFQALNQNSVSVIVTPQGWDAWLSTLDGQPVHEPLHALEQRLSSAITRSVCTFWSMHRIEEGAELYGTSDVFLPSGRIVHFAGCV